MWEPHWGGELENRAQLGLNSAQNARVLGSLWDAGAKWVFPTASWKCSLWSCSRGFKEEPHEEPRVPADWGAGTVSAGSLSSLLVTRAWLSCPENQQLSWGLAVSWGLEVGWVQPLCLLPQPHLSPPPSAF